MNTSRCSMHRLNQIGHPRLCLSHFYKNCVLSLGTALLFICLLLSPPLNSSALAQVEEVPPVEVFVTTWCPYCRMLERHLKQEQIPYKRYDIDTSSAGKMMHQEMGGGGVPVTRIDGDIIVRGFMPELISSAYESRKKKTLPGI